MYSPGELSSTRQMNRVGDAFGDTTYVKESEDPDVGYIRAYFTRRTDEYPEPGIIPLVGRSLYMGV